MGLGQVHDQQRVRLRLELGGVVQRRVRGRIGTPGGVYARWGLTCRVLPTRIAGETHGE